MFDRYPLIWCNVCNSAQPLLIDHMAADDLNDHDAADLICSACRLVIATVHAEPASVEEKVNDG